MQRIEIHQDFSLPVERVYAYLSEHENLGELFGARITRLSDGQESRNGVGSVRSLKLPGIPAFEETVTQAVPNELVEYRITKGSPLRDHRGEMRFAPAGSGSTLAYVIEFGSVVPGLDRVIAPGLRRSITKGLQTVDAKA